MQRPKPQIFLIHGGMTFKSKKDYLDYLKNRDISLEKVKWSGKYLDERLGKEFQIIRPTMPCKHNSKYSEWKINFERYFPLIKDNVILIGNSLGGIFLAKYLSENKFPKKILSVYLVCPPFDDTLPGEDLVGGFKLGKDLSNIDKNCNNLTLLFSKNDDVVPVYHAKKYRSKLKNAEIIIYNNIQGHFQIPTFPEIIKRIRRDLKRRK